MGVVSLASRGARHSCKKGKYASVCIMSNIRNSMNNYYVNTSGYTTPPMVTYEHKTLNSEMEKFQKLFMVWQITDDQMKKCSMYHFLVPEPHLYSCDYCDLITSIFLHCNGGAYLLTTAHWKDQSHSWCSSGVQVVFCCFSKQLSYCNSYFWPDI